MSLDRRNGVVRVVMREMALTASTPEARQSLDRLVVMYIMRAARREMEERQATRHWPILFTAWQGFVGGHGTNVWNHLEIGC